MGCVLVSMSVAGYPKPEHIRWRCKFNDFISSFLLKLNLFFISTIFLDVWSFTDLF